MEQGSNPPAFSGTGTLTESPPAVSDHELLRKIGSGSYGEVWLARSVTGVYRAVKVVNRSRFSDDEPYEREFEGIRRFEPVSREHAGLMDVLHVGRDLTAGFFYYVMELADDASLEGISQYGPARNPQKEVLSINVEAFKPKTLNTLLYESTPGLRSKSSTSFGLPASECLETAVALTSALAHMHNHGLVHRDIKPANIIFANGLPKLADIGLVTNVTKQSSSLGTKTYLPPEGSGEPRGDIYSLGLVLYEMITGFDTKEWPNLPVGWEKASEELKGLNAVAMRACGGDPERRYQTAAQMRSDLELLANKRLRKAERAVRRQRLIIGGLAGLLIAGAGEFRLLSLKQGAREENRVSILRDLQISRMNLRSDGWSSNYWTRMQQAAAIRKDFQVQRQASALLAGLDARLITVLRAMPATSAAFARDGRALIAGEAESPVTLINTNGIATQLSVRGAGPVCWRADGVPLQLTTVTNGLVLREVEKGVRWRGLQLDGANPSISDSIPVLGLASEGHIVAAALHNRLVVWNPKTGDTIHRECSNVTALAFSPDGALVGAGREDGTTEIYAATNLAEVAFLPSASRGSPIQSLAFGRDPLIPYNQREITNSWLLATGDQGAVLVVWDLAKRLPRSFCQGSTWTVGAVAISPDGLILASEGRNQPRLWDISTGKPLLQLSETSSGISLALAFDMTGRRLLTGGVADGGKPMTALWELEAHRGIQPLMGLTTPVRKVWFSGSSERVAALSDDWHLAVWNVNAYRLLFIFETPVGWQADNASGCFDSSSRSFAFATGQEARLYDLETGRFSKRWGLNKGLRDQLQYDASGRLLLLRCEWPSEKRGSIWRLYELDESRDHPVLLQEQTEIGSLPEGLALLPDAGKFLVWTQEKKSMLIRAFDVRTGKELWRSSTRRTIGGARVCFDPTGREFGYTDLNVGQNLRLIRASDFTEIGTTPDSYEAISPSGREFASSPGEGWFYPDLTGIEHGISIATDWDGLRYVSTFSLDGTMFTWGTEEGVVLVAHLDQVRRRLSGLRPMITPSK